MIAYSRGTVKVSGGWKCLGAPALFAEKALCLSAGVTPLRCLPALCRAVALTFGERVDAPLCGGRGGLLPPSSTIDYKSAHKPRSLPARAKKRALRRAFFDLVPKRYHFWALISSANTSSGIRSRSPSHSVLIIVATPKPEMGSTKSEEE